MIRTLKEEPFRFGFFETDFFPFVHGFTSGIPNHKPVLFIDKDKKIEALAVLSHVQQNR